MPEDAGSRAQAANPASGFGSCLGLGFFFVGKRMGRRRNKRENEDGRSFAKAIIYLEGFLFKNLI